MTMRTKTTIVESTKTAPTKKEQPIYSMEEKPIIIIKPEIYDAIFELAKRKLEWTLYAKFEPNGGSYGEFYVSDIIVPNQKNGSGESEVSHGEVDGEEDDHAEWQQRVHTEKGDDKTSSWFCWIHSHHTMGAFWSQTDQANKAVMKEERERNGLPFLCIVVSTNEKSPIKASVCYPTMNLDLEADVVCEKRSEGQEDPFKKLQELKEEAPEKKEKDEYKDEVNALLPRLLTKLTGPSLATELNAEIDKREKLTTYKSKKRYSSHQKYGQMEMFNENYSEMCEGWSKWPSANEEDADMRDHLLRCRNRIIFANDEDAGLVTDDMLTHINYLGTHKTQNKKKMTTMKEIGPEEGYYLCDDEYKIIDGKKIDNPLQTAIDAWQTKNDEMVCWFDKKGSPMWIYLYYNLTSMLVDEMMYFQIIDIFHITDKRDIYLLNESVKTPDTSPYSYS